MDYVLLALTALTVACQNITKKLFSKKSAVGVFFYSGMISMFAMLFFVVINDDWTFHPEQLGYSFGFAVSYIGFTLFGVLAMKEGSLAKTALVMSSSLLIPTFYGFLFLNEPVSIALLVGLCLLLIALWLINYVKESSGATWKWVIYAFLAFAGAGMCSVVQRMQNDTFGAEGKNLFMILALAMVTVILFVVALFSEPERQNFGNIVRKGLPLAALCGSFSGLCNMLVMYLNPRVAASVLFPVISGGGVVIAFLYAVIVLKEKFTLWQKVGYALGVISIVLMNL